MLDFIQQWQIVRAQLDPVRGSEQSGARPVLIVSTQLSHARLSVVTALPLTTRKPGRHIYRNEVLLSANAAGQPNESLVLIYQVRTLSKERLLTTVGFLSDEMLREEIRAALRKHFDL